MNIFRSSFRNFKFRQILRNQTRPGKYSVSEFEMNRYRNNEIRRPSVIPRFKYLNIHDQQPHKYPIFEFDINRSIKAEVFHHIPSTILAIHYFELER